MLYNFVIVKTASVQGNERYHERHKWRVIRADSRHDVTLRSYLGFYPVDPKKTGLTVAQVFNPSQFANFPISWAVAQVALHIPEIALADYHAQIIKNNVVVKLIHCSDVASMAISSAVYDWQGNLITPKEEGKALW